MQALSPSTVEAMRSALGARDATLLSVLAYAGLRPGEALGLRWRDIRERTLLVQRSVSLGEEADTKTRQHRTVRLLAPLAADLRARRTAPGESDDRDLVFPGQDRKPWTQAAYQSWRRRTFRRAISAAGLAHARPYDLRHSFASLLLHEGRSVVYVARQLGHDARLTLSLQKSNRRLRRAQRPRRIYAPSCSRSIEIVTIRPLPCSSINGAIARGPKRSCRLVSSTVGSYLQSTC